MCSEGGTFNVFSAQVAAVSGQINVAFALRDAQVAVAGGHGKSNLPRQLQVEIKAGVFEITTGQVQQPEAALLGELGTRGVIQSVGVLLRVTAHGLTHHGVDLIVFTGRNG